MGVHARVSPHVGAHTHDRNKPCSPRSRDSTNDLRGMLIVNSTLALKIKIAGRYLSRASGRRRRLISSDGGDGGGGGGKEGGGEQEERMKEEKWGRSKKGESFNFVVSSLLLSPPHFFFFLLIRTFRLFSYLFGFRKFLFISILLICFVSPSPFSSF